MKSERSSRGREYRLGAAHELVACAWLLSKGYEVFRNVCPNGPTDVVAIRGPEVVRIDVKTTTCYTRVDGTTTYSRPRLTEEQLEQGVRLLLVEQGSVLGYADEILATDGRRRMPHA